MKRILAVAVVIILAVPLLAFAQTCDSETCGDSLPPQPQDARGYLEFIDLVHFGRQRLNCTLKRDGPAAMMSPCTPE